MGKQSGTLIVPTWGSFVKNQLDTLISQLVDRGILLEEGIAEFEKRFIQKTLDQHQGNQSCAARALGIHRNTLSRKISLYQLSPNGRKR